MQAKLYPKKISPFQTKNGLKIVYSCKILKNMFLNAYGTASIKLNDFCIVPYKKFENKSAIQIIFFFQNARAFHLIFNVFFYIIILVA